MSSKKTTKRSGFLLMELLISIGIALISLFVTLNVFELMLTSYAKSINQISIRQNMRFAMQTMQQHIALNANLTKIERSSATKVIIQDISADREISFFVRRESSRGILYISTQNGNNIPGVNQLSDPNNVDVIALEAVKLDDKLIEISLEMQSNSGNVKLRKNELIYLINGRVL